MRDPRGSWLLLVAVAAIACVPTPANRLTPEPGSDAPSAATATPTPEPTPAGPTPSPSFARPTPTPPPDFVAYTIKRGDTLEKIAKRFNTTQQSIAYWNRVTYPTLDPESSKYRPDRIELGWVLLLIPDHAVDPEDLPTLSPKPTPKPTPSPSPSASA
jgi:nucleoid-associated protein YgaU